MSALVVIIVSLRRAPVILSLMSPVNELWVSLYITSLYDCSCNEMVIIAWNGGLVRVCNVAGSASSYCNLVPPMIVEIENSRLLLCLLCLPSIDLQLPVARANDISELWTKNYCPDSVQTHWCFNSIYGPLPVGAILYGPILNQSCLWSSPWSSVTVLL